MMKETFESSGIELNISVEPISVQCVLQRVSRRRWRIRVDGLYLNVYCAF